MEDEVLGVVGSISNTGKDPVLFADEVIRPDIPYKMIDEQKPLMAIFSGAYL